MRIMLVFCWHETPFRLVFAGNSPHGKFFTVIHSLFTQTVDNQVNDFFCFCLSVLVNPLAAGETISQIGQLFNAVCYHFRYVVNLSGGALCRL